MVRLHGALISIAVWGLSACGPGTSPADTSGESSASGEASGDSGATAAEASAGEADATAGDATSGDASATGSGSGDGNPTETTGDGDASASGSGGTGPNPTTGSSGTAGTGGGTPQELCEMTGGTWDEFSCGHYECGVPSPDACIQPGCDCGRFANYVEDLGCAEDPLCFDAQCNASSECLDDELCGGGCCAPFPGWCPDAVNVIPYTGSCSVQVNTGGVSLLVIPECGLGEEGGLAPCASGTDGVHWQPDANGPWTLTLCGSYCDAFAQTGNLELFMFCGE